MFRRLVDHGRASIRLEFEGTMIDAREGETIAAALMAASIEVFRLSAVTRSPRAPYCQMGVCFECVLRVDGQLRRACLEPVTEGSCVSRDLSVATGRSIS
jgi:predicted molibdopterin-dependent oxidoreductase YjgC